MRTQRETEQKKKKKGNRICKENERKNGEWEEIQNDRECG